MWPTEGSALLPIFRYMMCTCRPSSDLACWAASTSLQQLHRSGAFSVDLETISSQLHASRVSPVFVSAPNVRSTTEILWNCLSTLFLCTWSILCPSIPPQTTPKTTTHRHPFRFCSEVLEFLPDPLSFLAPEVVLGFALSARWSVRSYNATLERLAREDRVD
jgi:hypothetical protein